MLLSCEQSSLILEVVLYNWTSANKQSLNRKAMFELLPAGICKIANYYGNKHRAVNPLQRMILESIQA
jgi:hypothetical protein